MFTYSPINHFIAMRGLIRSRLAILRLRKRAREFLIMANDGLITPPLVDIWV